MIGPFLKREGEGTKLAGPALGLVELASIARGLVVADAMVKRAPVTLAVTRPISPGRYINVVTGEVAEVDEAMQAGVAAGGDAVVDRLFLAQAHAGLLRALAGAHRIAGLGSLGIVETASCASTLLAADAACKTAEVELADLRLADGLGGKAFFVVSGTLDRVEAAVQAAHALLAPGLLVGHEIIPAPHADLLEVLRPRR